MEYARLPGTELRVSRIGFGCEPLGGVDWGRVDLRQATAAVRRALELGINLFDTSDVYGLGRSEEALSRALGAQRHDAVIVTKFGLKWRRRRGGRAVIVRDASPGRVVEALEGSLRRLRIDCVPIYLVHWPDPAVDVADTIEALACCRSQGKLRHFGVSNFPPPLLRQALRIHSLAAVELEYSLIRRDAERSLLPLCQRRGVGVLVYGPLAQGYLTGKYGISTRFGPADRRSRLPHFTERRLRANNRFLDRLKTLGTQHGRSLAQVAIRWVLEHPAVACAITGAKSPAQIENNLGALHWSLEPAERRWAAWQR